MWNYAHSDELCHHGVKGQKWGVRRYQNADGSLTAAGKRRSVAEAQKQSEKQKKLDVKNRGTLSDADLKQKIARLQMEKQLRELTNEELHRGRSKILSVVETIGVQTVTGVTTTALKGASLYGLKAAFSKKFDFEDFGTAIFNGGAKKK